MRARVLVSFAPLAMFLLVLMIAPFVYAPGFGDDREPAERDGVHITQIVVRGVDALIADFYAWFGMVKLEEVLPGSTFLPAVVGSELIAGDWAVPGAVRRVRLADGSTALETITAADRRVYFAYKVWPEKGAGRRLVRYIKGSFHFSVLPDGRTRIEWRYTLKPRSAVGYLHASLFSALAVGPFLRSGIDAIKAAGEQAVA